MAPVIPDPNAIRSFKDRGVFEVWLSKHHDTAAELWLKIHKKDSGLASITHVEALDVALCWGWIDGLRKSLDERSFLQRYTPRTAKSIWSQINRAHVERLIAAGRMQAAGLRQIEAAKADGRWQRAYGSSRNMTLPDDLVAAIDANPRARVTFETLNSQNRFALGFRLAQIKSRQARSARIDEFVAMLARGETLHPNSVAKKRVVPAATREAATHEAATHEAAAPSRKKASKARKKRVRGESA
jgi:uncharacterized protein YdeI (YjbR/CyaY-like superfamily)